jgi:hypothetical protein
MKNPLSIFKNFKLSAKVDPQVPTEFQEGRVSSKAASKILGSDEFDPLIEETLSELTAPAGLRKFKNMEDNEPIIGGLLLRLKNVIKSANYEVTGENADLVQRQLSGLPFGIIGLLNDFSSSFTFGFSLNEKIWKVLNGEVTLIDLAPRYQLTITDWEKEKEKVFAKQQTSKLGAVLIPLTKCVHFTPDALCRNYYGKSMLRCVYKPYYYKASMEASEAQGIDRSLSGLPVLTAPEGFDFVNADSESPGYDEAVADTLDWAESVVSKVRKDEMQGVVKPAGWVLELLKGQTSSNINSPEVISRLNVEMAVGLLQTFAVMGGFASTNTSNIEKMILDFKEQCNTYLNLMEDVINRQIVQDICDFNLKTAYPKFRFASVTVETIADLASFVGRLVANEVITPTETLEKDMLSKIDVRYTTDDIKKLKDDKSL